MECRTILIGPACVLTRCDQSWGNAKGTPTSSDSSNKHVATVAANDHDHEPTRTVGKSKGKQVKRKEWEDKKADKQREGGKKKGSRRKGRSKKKGSRKK